MAHYKINRNKSSNKRYSGGRGAGNRTVKKFDPSLFIKKVEEKVVAAEYVPKNTFSDFLIEDQLKENISNKGYVAPTPIQDEAIPYLLEGRILLQQQIRVPAKRQHF